MSNATRRPPLPVGTNIEYCGMPAEVVHDDGGDRLTVSCEGHVQLWCWTFEGESCTVVDAPKACI